MKVKTAAAAADNYCSSVSFTTLLLGALRGRKAAIATHTDVAMMGARTIRKVGGGGSSECRCRPDAHRLCWFVLSFGNNTVPFPIPDKWCCSAAGCWPPRRECVSQAGCLTSLNQPARNSFLARSRGSLAGWLADCLAGWQDWLQGADTPLHSSSSSWDQSSKSYLGEHGVGRVRSGASNCAATN